MKVIEHINRAAASGQTLFSFEVLPPLKGKGIEALYDHLNPLMEFNPAYINVTYHRTEHEFRKNPDGSFKKVTLRKRPGTESICAAIMNKYKVDTVPHLICGGFNISETEDALINLQYLGIDNVLALRGDAAKNETAFIPQPDGHHYAVDLLKQVVNLNNGIYLEEEFINSQKTSFCIGVAGYPEKHFEAPNMQTDLAYLKEKINAGADYIVTQMFFDNAKYYAFVSACRAAGITAPIIPGLKPVYNKKQLTVLPKVFSIDLPKDLSDAIAQCKNNADVEKIGEDWLLAQSRDLKKNGVPGLHYYTLGKPGIVANVINRI